MKTASRDKPDANHPLRSAPPMFPHPARIRGLSELKADKSVMHQDMPDERRWEKPLSFALGFQQRSGKRVFGVPTAPDDELESGVKTVTFAHGHIDQIFDLLMTHAADAT